MTVLIWRILVFLRVIDVPVVSPTNVRPNPHRSEKTYMSTQLGISNPRIAPRLLIDLTPSQFENLIFDLVVAMGLRNVTWRTPGADGGRDIEATATVSDFAGTHTSQKWFIECKRYTGSVDWPTIYGKLAYADSHQADYLLMCTSSQYTPAAVTQADAWNQQRRKTKIRLWPGHELEKQLLSYPDIQLKYGLISTPNSPGKSIVSLALALSKTVATHYSNLIFLDAEPDKMLEASRGLSELLTQRMEDLAEEAKLKPVFKTREAGLAATYTGQAFKIDHYGFQAFIKYLFALSKTPLAFEGLSEYSGKASITQVHIDLLDRYSDVFTAIATWGDFEIQIGASSITISQRLDSA